MGRLLKASLTTAAAVAFSGTAFAQGVTLTPNTTFGTPGVGEYAYFFTADPPPAGFGFISADFAHNGIPYTGASAGGTLLTDGSLSPAGYWVDTFLFTILEPGLGSGDVSTSTATLETPTDLDFFTVLVNGVAATHTVNTDFTDQWTATNVNITAGALNSIQLVYNVASLQGNAGYVGHATFTPVPEPATWAMMLIGFGAVGYSLRRRRRPALAQAA